MTATRRNTWQREAVRAALAEARGFVSAQRLHEDLRAQGSTIGLATVYRALSALVEAGEADCLQSPEGENLFRSCATHGHHHHLICSTCGDVADFSLAPSAETSLDKALRRAADRAGFSIDTHRLDLVGTCQPCRG